MLGGYLLWHARIIVGFGSPNLTFPGSKWESQSEEPEVLQSNERPTQLLVAWSNPCLLIIHVKIAHWKAIMNSLKYVPPVECIHYPNWVHQFSQLIRCVVFLGLKTWNKQDPLRQEVPNFSILEDFMIIIFSSRTRCHHLCHKTANPWPS